MFNLSDVLTVGFAVVSGLLSLLYKQQHEFNIYLRDFVVTTNTKLVEHTVRLDKLEDDKKNLN
jgi:hypothetical protein